MRERPPHAASAPEGITSDSARKRQRLDKVISRVEGSLAGEQDEAGGSDNYYVTNLLNKELNIYCRSQCYKHNRRD